MIKQLNEVARMQQLAGIKPLNEEEEGDWQIMNKCFDDAADQIGEYEENYDPDTDETSQELSNEEDVKNLANEMFKKETGRDWY